MKQAMKAMMCVALAISVFLYLCACGAKNDTPAATDPVIKQNAIGRYELEKIQYADGTVASGETLQQAEEAMGDMYVELFSDGTAQLSLLGQIKDMEFSADQLWQSDSTFNTYAFSVSNGRVTLERDGDTYIFVKK